MGGLKASLQGKLGPLKRWQWLAILAGGLLVYRHLHPSAAAATGADVTGGAPSISPSPSAAFQDIPLPAPVSWLDTGAPNAAPDTGGNPASPSPSPVAAPTPAAPAQVATPPVVQVTKPTPIAAVLQQVRVTAPPKPPSAAPTAAAIKSALTTIHPPVAPAAKIRYYTYKKDVPLGAGQTLHFTSTKGYYAA